MTRTAVKRPVTTFMILVVVVVYGVLSMLNLNLALMPDMDLPYALVMTNYTGASPDTVQDLVTKPIEGSLATINGVKSMVSLSQEGMSIVQMEFETDIDIDMATIDMREKLDMIKGFLPDDTDEPMVIKLDMNMMSSMMISVSSEKMDLVRLKTAVDDEISDRIERQNGVAQVSISGGLDEEIEILLLEDRLRGYNVSESAIISKLSSENAVSSGGTIRDGNKKLTIKTDGDFTSLDEIKNLPITTSSGQNILLQDVAVVQQRYKEKTSASYVNGNESVMISITKASDANAVEMADNVKAEIAKLEREYPDLHFTMAMDTSDFIKNAISSVASTAVQGILFSILILYIFLRNFRTTIIVGTSIPLSILLTVWMMDLMGMTLNMMSLGGLTLGVGMLVDNSIVVLESIFRRLEQGFSRTEAAIDGTREVSMSIVASTLTTIAVFLPISMAGGMISQMFTSLSLTITVSLCASLLMALTFVPMMCALILKPSDINEEVQAPRTFFGRGLNKISAFLKAMDRGYKRSVRWALRHKKIVIAIGIVFFVVSVSLVAVTGFELMPGTDQSQINISVEMPSGTAFSKTQEVMNKVVDRVEGTPEIKDMTVSVGGSGSFFGGSEDSGSVTLTLVGKSERKRGSEEIASDIRRSLSDVAGANITVNAATSMMSMGGSSTPISIELYSDDLDQLAAVSNDIVRLISDVPGVRDADTDLSNTSDQVVVHVDRLKASSYGLTSASIAQQVAVSIRGSTATTYKVGGKEYDVVIRQDQDKYSTIHDIQNMLIPTATGGSVPLYAIAEVSIEAAPLTIYRIDQKNYTTVTAGLDGRDLGSVSREIESKLRSEYVMPEGCSYQMGGDQADMVEQFGLLLQAMALAVFLVFAVMAAEFESLYSPFIILFTIPIALSSGIMGLFFMGQTVSLVAMIGFIMLLGIVVNNAIVLIDYTNLLRAEGMDAFEAVATAGPVRLRAILMSTLTTMLGMLPLMLSSGEGSESMGPLATVVFFGLGFSTLVTLYVVPCVYLIFERFKDWRKRRKQKRRQRADGTDIKGKEKKAKPEKKRREKTFLGRNRPADANA